MNEALGSVVPNKDIFVVKRDGKKEKVNFDKIHLVLQWACEGYRGVSVSDIEMNAKLKIVDGMPTKKIHTALIQACVDLITPKNPNYQYVAGRLLNYLTRKEVFGVSKNSEMPHLKDVIDTNIKRGIYDAGLITDKYTAEEMDMINDFIKHERDFSFAYAGVQQLVDKYLLKDRETKQVYETPQYMFAVIAMVFFSEYKGQERLNYVRKFYNAASQLKINLPTPVMAGVRTPTRQYSSCVLIDVGDDMKSLYSSNSAVAAYTAKRAGIGLNFGRIRGVGTKIRNGEVISTGVVPFLKWFEAACKCTSQNGVRGGGATIYYPFWHQEVEDLLVLKNNKGTEETRARKLDYNIQLSRMFYQRVIEDGEITLFSPHAVPDMYDAFGNNEKFDALYLKYEADPKIKKKKVKARELLESICRERIETGRLYIMNIDHVNQNGSFKDPVKMSNLCVEITLPTTPINDINKEDGEIAICVLSAINLGSLKNLEEIEEITDLIVRSLDYIVGHQDYPVEPAKKMLKRRSLGIGVTNFAYYLAKNKVGYDSSAYELVDRTFEYIQYYALKASCQLAKEQGACEYFDRTKYSDGILPIDKYNKNVDVLIKRPYDLDWESLRADIKTHGLRNSVLTALMPCESSSVVGNSTNGIEPPRSLISIKQSKQGLLKQVVPEINKIGHQYTTAWELPDNKGYTELVAIMQKWVDQSISANHYYDFTSTVDGKLNMSTIVGDLLYSYQLGVKTLYYANSNDGKTDDDGGSGCAGGACSV